ncbi:hypothetical protein AGMMS49975_06180 [Clostridia bacterium]|nr:hypothetical protein AGMMS49975_06180 [Clostridia bacterium]
MDYGIDKDFTGTRIIHGDTLRVLKDFPSDLFGGIITEIIIPYLIQIHFSCAILNIRQKLTKSWLPWALLDHGNHDYCYV